MTQQSGQVQWRGNHPGVDYIFNSNGSHGTGLPGSSVFTDGHSHLGQLLRRGAVEVHVHVEAIIAYRPYGGQAVKLLKAVRRRVEAGVSVAAHAAGADGDAAGAGQAAVGDNGLKADAAGSDLAVRAWDR